MKSYPFTSKKITYDEQGLPVYDRAVDSAFLRKVFSNYFSDGVFYKPANALQVVSDTGMQVAVEPGVCHIRGAMGIEENRRTLVVQASEEMDRIDTVVARLDLSVDVRSVDLYVLKGTAAESPQPPALTRDSTKWEIGLANLFVAKNVTTISQQRITDTRLDPDRCGVVAQTIGDLDTAPYFAQLTAAIAQHQTDAQAQIAALQAAIEAVEGDSAWMMKELYDPQGKEQDVFLYAEEQAKSAANTSKGYTDEVRQQVETDAAKTYAPKAHASSGTSYGVATASLYGHTKLSDTASNSYGATSGVAATPKCVYQSLLPQKLTPTFKNSCTNAGSTTVYHVGRLVVCQISVHLPAISAGKWLTMLTIPSVRAITNVACRAPTINGGPSRDFLITTENSVCVANLYVEPEDSGHDFNISVSFISSV